MSGEYVRRCPTCGAENAPQVMRCGCGALLAGVDLVSKAAPPAPAAPAVAPPEQGLVCPHDDCGQTNPPGSTTCLYCNRPLAAPDAPGLMALPQALRARYRILKPLPAKGAEAELLLVQGAEGEPVRVAKIYRHGIQPRPDVRQRVTRIDVRHRVELLETGVSDGHAYELMEYCATGSLRERMKDGPLPPPFLATLVRELAGAIAEVHAAGLLHRDLKPENVLLRTLDPLDVVLTDFGIASVLDATQRFTGTARTLPYAAPETLSGVLDRKADYWALGMIVLEGALGRHPFADLSEAVILHHLTTREIDLTEVADRTLRKLLRGLLMRDPKARWGAAEIERWLAGDASLPEPAAAAGPAFATPYHLGPEVCHNGEQLAVALARNWREGLADIANGQLLAWFRDVQKDQNAVRLLIEMRQDSRMSIDLQLLKLILHLAPGIPPVWRGESIGLQAILARAARALKGDEEAQGWLHRLHENRVIDAIAAAGNPEAEELSRRWGGAFDEFSRAWERGAALAASHKARRAPHEYANFDRMVYGADEPRPPPLGALHARLLAAAYDPRWLERLRQRLRLEATALAANCPWLAELGDPAAMNAAQLVALEALLPEARGAADQARHAEARRRDQDAEEGAALQAQLAFVVEAIRLCALGPLGTAGCFELDALLERHFELLARIRASDSDDPAWETLRKTAARTQARATQMRLLLDTLTERRAANAGWLSVQMFGLLALLMFVLPPFLGPRIVPLLAIVGAALAAWRLLPAQSLKRRIRELARGLS